MVIIQCLAGALAVGGFAYLILAIRHTSLGLSAATENTWHPPVTVMIPAHGSAQRLEECLNSICRQDYPAALQVIFGLHTPDDEARPVIERVMARFPSLDSTLVIDTSRLGANPKNVNLTNMLPAAKHDVLVMVDSDVLVQPGFLAAMVQPLEDPQVGGVTCLYSGSPAPGLASHLGALYHNDWFIPSVLVDLTRREMDILYGAAIAISRHALEAIGGFAPMANAVAQDFVLGNRLYRHGFKLRLAGCMVATVVAEPSLGRLIRHELRWNRAVRAVRPRDHLLSIFMNPLVPLALLLTSWPATPAVGLIALHLVLRQVLHHRLRRHIPLLPAAEPWLVPLREGLNIVVWLWALAGRKVYWGETELITGDGLSMTPTARETFHSIPR